LRFFELCDDTDPEIRLRIAHCLLNTGRPEKAEKRYRTIIEDTDDPLIRLRSRLGIAKGLCDAGNLPAAKRFARQTSEQATTELGADSPYLSEAEAVLNWLDSLATSDLDQPGD
jgi:uncharacterized membrane-anchored protein